MSSNDTPGTRRTGSRVAEALVLVVLVAAPLSTLIEAIGIVRGDAVAVSVLPPTATSLTFGATTLPLQEAVVEVVPSTAQAWAIAAAGLTAGLFVAAVAWMVYRVLVDARTEPGPFRTGMAGRLFRIALVVAVGGTAVTVLDDLPNVLLTPDVAGMTAVVSFAPLLLGVVIGWLAEVFRRGEAMERELAGLV